MNKAIEHEQGRYRPIDCSRPQPDDNWPYRHQPISGNDPQYGVKAPKFERHIFIRQDQIIFLIDSQIGMIADARKKPDGTEDSALSNATTKYRSMFASWIDKHIGEAKTIMSASVLEGFQETAMNNIKDKEEVDITLLVPEWYDDTTFQQLCDAVNSYIVNATLFDYFSLSLTSKDPVTQDKQMQKMEGESEIRKLINFSKPGRISKPFKPF
jgi:hypothetical protein